MARSTTLTLVILASIATLFGVFAPAVSGFVQDPAAAPMTEEPPSLDQLFEEALAKQDEDAITASFRDRPFEVILLVDGYLEAWLSNVEGKAEKPVAKPEELLDRGLLAAKHADRVFEGDAYTRYASAWKGWSEKQRKQFRAGQEEFYGGRALQKEKEYDDAKARYERSLEIASPLGDLWGIAQAHQALGDLAIGRDDLEVAIRHHTEAAKIFGSLRHAGMLRSHRALATVYEKKGDVKQARAELEKMLTAAIEARRPDAAKPVRADLVRLCRVLGDEAAAKKYEDEAGG
jgi:tetratricopeptide (TPR) repeat protein